MYRYQNKLPYDLDTELDFGSYKGTTIQSLIDYQVSSIRWYLTKVDNFILTKSALTYYKKSKSFRIRRKDTEANYRVVEKLVF